MNKRERRDQHFAFPSALLTTDNSTFEEHLKSRSKEISMAISDLLTQNSAPDPNVSELKGQVAQLLAIEKGHVTALEKSRLQRESLEERLENASLRYMVAEKKLDRAKSATVARLEAQAIAGGRNETGSGLGSDKDVDQKDIKSEEGEGRFEVEKAHKETVAASAKQQEQLETFEAENDKLNAEVGSLKARLIRLSDDDYSKTDLFKLAKTQLEESVKRVNDLEARNVQLQEEAEKEHASRTAYRLQLEKEAHSIVAQKDAQLTQAENDLARVRSARDDYLADNNMRKAAQAQERKSIEYARELANSKDERIKALESEVERHRSQNDPPERQPLDQSKMAELSMEELVTRCTQSERQASMLKTELESMIQAFTKTNTAATLKVEELQLLEEKALRLQAEKSKADQKYFSTMKLKDANYAELKIARQQGMKSSEAMSQLKESEHNHRQAFVHLEKQIAELKAVQTSLQKQLQTAQQTLNEKTILYEGSRSQFDELRKQTTIKEASTSKAKVDHRKLEAEFEALKVRLEETQKSLESWRTKGLGNQNAEYEALRVSCRTFITPEPHTNCGTRLSPFALSAGSTLRTLASPLAVTSSVRAAWRKGGHLGRENAPIATGRLGRMIPFTSRSDPGWSLSSL